MGEAPKTCPYLVTVDEGTTYCGLAESAVLEQIEQTERLRAAIRAHRDWKRSLAMTWNEADQRLWSALIDGSGHAPERLQEDADGALICGRCGQEPAAHSDGDER